MLIRFHGDCRHPAGDPCGEPDQTRPRLDQTRRGRGPPRRDSRRCIRRLRQRRAKCGPPGDREPIARCGREHEGGRGQGSQRPEAGKDHRLPGHAASVCLVTPCTYEELPEAPRIGRANVPGWVISPFPVTDPFRLVEVHHRL
jgi:hypothetical protein